jgi:hypothetical protein
LILSEIDLLVKYTEPEACRKTLMPLVYKGYECGVAQIQTAVMDKTPALIKELADINFVRINLLPRFLQGIINSKLVPVKESGLKALACIFSQFDRGTMVETIIPSMEKFKKFDITGPMVMHLLTIYEGISKVLGHKATSVNILPALLPLLVEAELSKTEFEKLFTSMIAMMHLIKDARAGELTDVKDELVLASVRNEEVEEVNDIFRDIFDQGPSVDGAKGNNMSKEPRNEHPAFQNSFGGNDIHDDVKNDTRSDFNFPKVDFAPVKSDKKPDFQFDPMKDFNFTSAPGRGELKKNEVKDFPAKIEPMKTDLKDFPRKSEPLKSDVLKNDQRVNPFNLDFGKNDPGRNDLNKNDPFLSSGTWKSPEFNKSPASVDPFQFNPSKNDGFTGTLPFLEPQLASKPAAKPSPIIGDIFSDFQSKKEENKAPKYNLAINPLPRVEDPKPGSLKPPMKKSNNAEKINTDDFFNQFLNNSNKKDPFAGL